MTIAFLILAHTNPEQLARLVNSLPADSPVVIHVDARSQGLKETASKHIEEIRRVHFSKSERCYWGRYGIVAGTLNLMSDLERIGRAYTHAMLLSGSDYPCMSHSRIQEFVDGLAPDGCMESFPLDEPNRWTKQVWSPSHRYLGYHFWFRSHHFRLWDRTLPACIARLYGGCQWWCLSRDAVRYVLNFVDAHPEYGRYFANTLIPDEAFFQTIVGNSPFANSVTSTDTKFSIWSRPAPPWPAILTTAELPEILASGKPFARKFDSKIDSRVLDALDVQRADVTV